jgi:hypothetical protein
MDPATVDPTTVAAAGWSLWTWITIGLALGAAVVGGIIYYKTHKSALGALQAGIEIFIGKLAARGMPTEAQELGSTVGESVTKAGPWVKRLNNALHKKTKVKVAAEHPAGKNTRELITEAFQKERPDAS